MTSERFRQAAQIFEEALERPLEERRAFLAKRCEDEDLRRDVAALLEAEGEADLFLEEPLPVSSVPSDGDGGLPGNGKVGSYRLLRRLGQGGMSTVFLAVRDDDTFQRRVAVKLIRQGMENPNALQRLKIERQILASLHHPNVAELYDGGATPEGLPYFVMEYVEGHPIDVYCERAQLSLDQRIELFCKVCEAVQYAHQNLVVHRDIKPSNILVTGGGVPKLLDFGIAKLLNPELAGSEIEPTVTWMRLLTPQYASPEQVRGDTITTASDVYSLGVLLYKLLTGRLPRRLEGRSAQEIERELSASEPARPSTAASRGAAQSGGLEIQTPDLESDVWYRKLRGDLDMITLKALRSSPQQRYGSPVELATDLKRYTTGLPVQARQGNLSYHASKFLRRHLLPLAAAALLVALVFAFAVAMAVQSARVAHERDEARRERDEKQEVLALVQDLFKLADPGEARGTRFTVREALDQSGGAIERRLDGQPAVEAALRQTMGTIYLNLGLLDEAQGHLARVLELRRELHGEGSLEFAESLSALSAVHREKGEYARANELSNQAVEQARRFGDAGTKTLIRTLNGLVTLLCYQGNYDAADEPSQEALTLVHRYLDDRRPETAEAVNNRAVVLRQEGRLDEAEAMYRRGLRISRIVLGEEHPEVANLLNNLAVVLKARSDLAGATAVHRETLALRRRLYGDAHPAVAQSLTNLASVLRAAGSYGEAEAAYREAVANLNQTLGAHHPMTVQVSIVLGSLLAEADQAPSAESWLSEGLVNWRLELGPSHPLVAWAESTLGGVLKDLGRHHEAEALLVRSLAPLSNRYGEGHIRTRRTRERLVELYRVLGQPEMVATYAPRVPTTATD